MKHHFLRILLLLLLSGCSLAFVIRRDRIAFVATDNDRATLEPAPTQEPFFTNTPENTASPTLIPSPTIVPTCTVRYSGGMNIRKTPSKTGELVGTIGNGKTATYLAFQDRPFPYRVEDFAWFKINYLGTIGWVATFGMQCVGRLE